MSSTDLVSITLKGLFPDYKVFISYLVARQIPPKFTKLGKILIQEEERMNIYEPESQTADRTLMARGRYPHRGKFRARHRGMSRNESSANKDVVCHYCGKSGHIARDCFKKINNDSNNRYRKHYGNYVRKDTPDINGFKNLRLFIYEHALSAEMDDENAWFIDSSASSICLIIETGMMSILKNMMEHTSIWVITGLKKS